MIDVDKLIEGHQLVGSLAPFWNLTDWDAEGKSDLQGTPVQIISEAWETIDVIVAEYDKLRAALLDAPRVWWCAHYRCESIMQEAPGVCGECGSSMENTGCGWRLLVPVEEAA